MQRETRIHFDTLAKIMNGYWHADDGGPHQAKQMRQDLSSNIRPDVAARFKSQLASAIAERSVTIKDLEQWTLLALDSEEEVAQELLRVWQLVYGDDDPIDFQT